MKVLLRIIAAWTGLTVLVSLLLLAHLASGRLARTTWLLLVGLAVTALLGAYASVELWRLRHRGRYAAAGLFAFWGLVTLASMLFGRYPSAAEAFRLAVAFGCGGVLLLPAARHACT